MSSRDDGSVADDDRPAYPRRDGAPVRRRSVVTFVNLLGTSENAGEDAAQATLEKLDAPYGVPASSPALTTH